MAAHGVPMRATPGDDGLVICFWTGATLGSRATDYAGLAYPAQSISQMTSEASSLRFVRG